MREAERAEKSQLTTLSPQQNFDEGPFEKRIIIQESTFRKGSSVDSKPLNKIQHIPLSQTQTIIPEDLLLPPQPTLWNNFILNIWHPLQRFIIGI